MRQMAMLNAGMGAAGAGFAGAAAAGNRFGRSLANVRPDLFGTRMQYLGRQLQYSFTIPLLAAGAAAMHWALENEKAMTRVIKVYGDADHGAEQLGGEIKALERNFVALSNTFGVHQAEVINIAADWAAAGASGIALAKATELTLKTMVLGEIEAKEATKALIAIQAQYGLSIEELTEAIAVLNMVENQTGASLKDLIDGFSRAAGVARTAGVDVRHLAAMMAALVPATGSAAQAGNALKTIFSRLVSPTGEAAEVMALMGININDMSWKAVNVTDRLMIMAKAFEGLSDSQKGVVASVVASRWQINKFEVLMRELISDSGFYARALESTTDKTKVFAQMTKELNAVLSSNPRRLQIIWTMLQNAMADIIQPMIPLLLAAASAIQSMMQSFSELDPALQKFILGVVLILALAGPLVMYLGAIRILFAEIALAMMFLMRPLGAIVAGFRALLALNVMAWFAGVAATIGGVMTSAISRIFGLSILIPRWIATWTSAFIILRMLLGVFTRMWLALWSVALLGVQRLVAMAGPLLLASFRRLWFFPIALTMQRFAATMGATWAAFMLGIQRITAAAAVGLRGIWSAMFLAMTLIGFGARISISAMFISMYAGLIHITRAFGTALARVWTAIHVTLHAMTIAFSATLAAVWRAMAVTAASAGAAVAFAFARGFAMLGGFLATLGTRLVALARAIGTAITVAFSGPWGWAIAAVIAAVAIFHKQIGQIWNNIVNFFRSNSKALVEAVSPIVKIFVAARNGIIRAFNSLPAGVRNALIAVVRIMHAAAMQIYKLMQYLNPFARHSPSLVENVVNGMAIIRREYASVSNVGQVFAQAGMDLREFGEAIRHIQRAADAKEWAEIRTEIAKLAPAALASFDRLVVMLNPLKDLLFEIGLEMQAQQDIVDALRVPLDAANVAYEEQDKILQALIDTAQEYEDQLSEAKDRLNDFANAPIEGMKAMEDAIFANQMAQKELQLEMLKMERAIGPLDKLQDRIDAINGEIELLRGEQNDLRQAGAGSDILGEYDTTIDLLEQQKQAIVDQVKPLQELQDQIEELGKEGQILDLENSLQFDPLKKQIDDLANSMEELPFDEIIAGMQAAQADVDKYTDALEDANAAVASQQAIVDELKKVRDQLQATYDVENAKLEEIKNRYSEVEDRIRSIEQAFRDVKQAAEEAFGAGGGGGGMSPGAENFLGAEGGDFPGVGGVGGIGRDDWSDQSAQIDAFTKELADKTKNMFGLFNFLEPIKRGWNAAMDWLGGVLGPTFSWIGGLFSNMFKNVTNPFEKVDWGKGMETIQTAVREIGKWLQYIWDLLGPELVRLWEQTWPALKGAFSDIGKELVKFKDLIGPMMETTKNLWTVLGPILGIVLALILLVVKALLGMLAGALPPVITAIGEFVAGVIELFRSIYLFVAALFSGDWAALWDAVVGIFHGAWMMMWSLLKGLVMTIVGLVVGLVKSIWEWLVWLYDVLVGHSIIPDLVNSIIGWFTKMKDWLVGIFQAVVNFIVARWNDIVAAFNWAKGAVGAAVEAVKGVINGITSAISNVWNNVQNYINMIVNAFNGLRNRFSFGGLFDGIVGAFRAAINSVIGKWNSMSFGIGDVKIGTPDIPFFARGGMITDGAMAIVGEGRQAYPEYVIPTDPNFRGRAIALFLALGKQLGLGSSHSNMLLASILAGQEHGMFGQRVQAFASGGILGRGGRVSMSGRASGIVIAPVTKTYNITFTGNVEFPNVKSGNDAQTFLDNLEALIGS